MMDHTHIADGIAVKLLLVGIVLAGGAVGALGLAPVASQATADDVDDGPAADRSPQLAFPINNVTVTATPWDVRATAPIRSTDVGTADGTLFRAQDMDPY